MKWQFMKTQNTGVYGSVVMTTVFCSFLFMAHYSGQIGVTKLTGGEGCSCHNELSSVKVVIAGPSSLGRGGTGTFTVTITGGPLLGAGVDIAVSSGKLISNPGEEYLSADLGELTHTMPKPPADNKVVFTFDYIAPATAGTVTLFAVGNSVNNDGDNTGDAWNFASNKPVTITSTTGISEENKALRFSLDQNYPNPFNPSSVISYQLPVTGFVTLKIYDIAGNEIETLVNEERPAGRHEVKFDGKELPSGVYLYSIISGGYSVTKKMVLAK